MLSMDVLYSPPPIIWERQPSNTHHKCMKFNELISRSAHAYFPRLWCTLLHNILEPHTTMMWYLNEYKSWILIHQWRFWLILCRNKNTRLTITTTWYLYMSLHLKYRSVNNVLIDFLASDWLHVGTKHRARGPWEMRGLRSRCGHEYMHRLCSSFVPWTTFALGSHSGSWALRTSSGKSTSLVLRPLPTASMRAGSESSPMLWTGSPSPPNNDFVRGPRESLRVSQTVCFSFFFPCCDGRFCQIVVIFVKETLCGGFWTKLEIRIKSCVYCCLGLAH